MTRERKILIGLAAWAVLATWNCGAARLDAVGQKEAFEGCLKTASEAGEEKAAAEIRAEQTEASCQVCEWDLRSCGDDRDRFKNELWECERHQRTRP